jgi:hypothetical protein
MAFFDVNPIHNKDQFNNAVSRMTAHLRNANDDEVAEGLNWYKNVNSAVKASVPDLGTLQHPMTESRAAGIVGAVSPNMDFARNNINALDEIRNIKPEHWDMIRRSAEGMTVNSAGQPTKARRIPEVGHMLKEIAPSLSASPDTGLMKAHRLLQGEQLETVLPRRTAPKTNAFARNILLDPSVITIDGRSSDMISNTRLKWQDNRGINSADLARGKTSRYEDHEEVLRQATTRAARLDPRLREAGLTHGYEGQAITWVRGKNEELRRPDGTSRKVGTPRVGQPYDTGPLRGPRRS